MAAPVEIRGGGDVLIGVVNRFVTSGATPPTQPGAQDTGASQQRSWVATWTGDPPDPPVLPSDQSMFLVDAIVPGNWMIRWVALHTRLHSTPGWRWRGGASST